ncbi:MAG TPA: dihydrodipicolinate synthase family protein [Thermodesulfobacteriota bacterium]
MVPIVPTPFLEDGSLDHDGLVALCEFAVAKRVAAVCLPAFASEFYKLSERERLDVVRLAVKAVGGRVPVIGQSNHGSARVAAELARANQDAGASVVAVALPRAFAYTSEDLLEFARTVGRAVEVPLLVQDWNPTGPTIDAAFCARLREQCPNFRYVKLEEPQMGAKVRAIRAACGDEVRVLEGWGGVYMLELIPAGIDGVMPGLAVIDVLQRVWDLAVAGRAVEAYEVFAGIHPWLAFTLRSLESLNYLEKDLLVRRGVLRASHVRHPTITVDEESRAYASFLMDRVLEQIAKL